MNWPQIVFLVCMVLGTALRIFGLARDKDFTSGGAAAGVLVILLWQGFVVYLLHEGGFW